MHAIGPITVVETHEFLNAVRKLLDETEREVLVDFLARNPKVGDLIPGSGGVRKLRWALEGRGKRGGARVVYFFHGVEMPLYLLTAYAKNVRENLQPSEMKAMQKLTRTLIEMNRRREPGA